MTIDEVIAAGLDVPRNGKPGPAENYWPAIWPMIVRAAFDGAPCPRNQDIAAEVGCSDADVVSMIFRRAVKRGDIAIEYRGNVRRIVLPTGQATAWSRRVRGAGGLDGQHKFDVKRRREEAAAKRQDILDILIECVRTGSPAPTNEAIGARVGYTAKTVAKSLKVLKIEGKAIQHGYNQGRSFDIPGHGHIARYVKPPKAPKPPKPPKERKAKAAKPPKAPKSNWYMMRAATTKDDAFHAAMLKRATRVDAVDAPVTGDDEHAAMLARFIARGGKPMKCPDGFGAHRSIHEVLG